MTGGGQHRRRPAGRATRGDATSATYDSFEYHRATRRICGEGRICATCGATYETFADVCSAPLEVMCEGFLWIDRAKRIAYREVVRAHGRNGHAGKTEKTPKGG